jgi:uncharacterized protein (TIGR00251 family)
MISRAISSDPSPFHVTDKGLRVAVRLQPKAARDEIIGVEPGAGGTTHLKVKVTAAPESGKANAALEKLLAKAWRVAPSTVSVIAGGKSREKSVLVSGDGRALERQIKEWQAAQSRHG